MTGTFLNTLKFNVKDCDPTTGDPDEEVGYADEYVVSWGGRGGELMEGGMSVHVLCKTTLCASSSPL